MWNFLKVTPLKIFDFPNRHRVTLSGRQELQSNSGPFSPENGLCDAGYGLLVAKDYYVACIFHRAVSAPIDLVKKQNAARKVVYVALAASDDAAFDSCLRSEQIPNPGLWIQTRRALWFHTTTL